jgi:hypothetical protein
MQHGYKKHRRKRNTKWKKIDVEENSKHTEHKPDRQILTRPEHGPRVHDDEIDQRLPLAREKIQSKNGSAPTLVPTTDNTTTTAKKSTGKNKKRKSPSTTTMKQQQTDDGKRKRTVLKRSGPTPETEKQKKKKKKQKDRAAETNTDKRTKQTKKKRKKRWSAAEVRMSTTNIPDERTRIKSGDALTGIRNAKNN